MVMWYGWCAVVVTSCMGLGVLAFPIPVASYWHAVVGDGLLAVCDQACISQQWHSEWLFSCTQLQETVSAWPAVGVPAISCSIIMKS